MKRYVRLFESYLREYREHQQPEFPEGMHGYEGPMVGDYTSEFSGRDEDPTEIAMRIAAEYGIDPADVEETMGEAGADSYGMGPSIMDIGLMVTPLVSLVLAGVLGSNIEAKLKNKRWLTAEIEGRLEAMMEENPELVEEDKEALMRTITDEVMNDPEITEKLKRWRKDGGAPTHARRKGPKYGYKSHIFGSGY
jgi:hypothetical protein